MVNHKKVTADRFNIYPIKMDLIDFVDTQRATCLNIDKKTPLSNLFTKESTYISSLTDEQLLIFVPFQSFVNLKSILISAFKDGKKYNLKLGTCPKKIKLFSNKQCLDFDNANSLTPNEEINFTQDSIDKKINLKPLKFKNISSVTVSFKFLNF